MMTLNLNAHVNNQHEINNQSCHASKISSCNIMLQYHAFMQSCQHAIMLTIKACIIVRDVQASNHASMNEIKSKYGINYLQQNKCHNM